ncbi:Phenylalanine racemase (ATP-hydrolyzing) [Burkholderia sp. lig30]|jgi:surfactin family lipopeptide synthetase A|nr:Phenylalanine racemase (ATP-hydrolyzing) [Burkholderia sp. lig30]
MGVRAEVGDGNGERRMVRLDGDELLCRVPCTGMDWAMLEGMILRHAPATGAGHAPPPTRGAAEQPLPPPVHRPFEVYAQLNPGARAVKYNQRELTYGELDSQADGLAALLQANGLGPGKLCAVCMQGSLALVRAILAVLKAGGACLPLDPALHETRIAATLGASHASTVITQQGFASKFDHAGAQIVVCGEESDDLPGSWPQDSRTDGVSPACAICRFSEADTPDIVVKDHRNVIDRLESMQEISPIGQGDSLLQSADFAFDASVWEFLWPLTHGARLVILPARERIDLERIRQVVAQEHITVMHVNLR